MVPFPSQRRRVILAREVSTAHLISVHTQQLFTILQLAFHHVRQEAILQHATMTVCQRQVGQPLAWELVLNGKYDSVVLFLAFYQARVDFASATRSFTSRSSTSHYQVQACPWAMRRAVSAAG